MKREDTQNAPGTLASALSALADETADVNAPASVEIAALSAFRSVHARTATSEVASPNVAVLARWRRPAWLASAAAAGLIAVLGIALTLKPESNVTEPASQPAVVAHVPQVDPPRMDPAPIVTPSDVSQAPRPRDAAWRGGRVGRIQPVRDSAPAAGADADTQPYEVTTDYYALVAGGDLAPVDGGQVVRMRVPRASLTTLGFQMDADRDDGQVTADVVLGNDGIARAIRFVQTIDTAKR